MRAVIVILALTPFLVGATCLKASVRETEQCLASTIQDARDAGVDQLEPLVHYALHLDWPAALQFLLSLSAQYGEEFITCVVRHLRQQYADWLAKPDAGAEPAVAVQPGGGTKLISIERYDRARALYNAEAWVAGNRGQ